MCNSVFFVPTILSFTQFEHVALCGASAIALCAGGNRSLGLDCFGLRRGRLVPGERSSQVLKPLLGLRQRLHGSPSIKSGMLVRILRIPFHREVACKEQQDESICTKLAAPATLSQHCNRSHDFQGPPSVSDRCGGTPN